MASFKKYILLILVGLVFFMPKVYYLTKAYQTDDFNNPKSVISGDAGHYLQIGDNISKYGVYSDNDSNIPTESATWRPPIWPTVIASFYLITHSLFGLMLLKSVLELLIILSAIFILRRSFKWTHYEVLPFFLLLLEPQYIKYSTTFLSESLTAVLLLLLSVSFITLINHKKYRIVIVVLSVLVLLCHPVSVFFIGALLLFYGLINLKKRRFQVFFHALLFVGLVFLWPIRNELTFKKGFYLTTSQGAAFSKGWNKDVAQNFNNVDGDLADEDLNLRNYLANIDLETKTIIDLNKLYTQSTLEFIKSISLKEKLSIIWVKVKANFTPFPMIEKETFIDTLATPFRIFYLFVFIQAIYFLVSRRTQKENNKKHYASLVVLAIIIGQTLMAIYVYTGIRFNAIYGLTMLFVGVLFNFDLIFSKLCAILKKENTCE